MKQPTMKVLTLAISTAFLFSIPAMASTPRKVTINQENLEKLPATDQQRVLCIADRLEEITAMDRRAMARIDRQALAAETSALKSEANAYNQAGGGNVIYISTAGIIIIVLLLIILL